MHRRAVCVAMMPDIGDKIVTKYRYVPIVGYNHTMGNSNVQVDEEAYLRLKANYPDVFDRNGIRFFTHDPSVAFERDTTYGWTIGSCIATLGITPGCDEEQSRKESCTVELLDFPDARHRIKTYKQMNTAFSFLVPSSLLCYVGSVGIEQVVESKKFTVRDISILYDLKLNGGIKAVDHYLGKQAEDYAIVATLKKFEEEGLISNEYLNYGESSAGDKEMKTVEPVKETKVGASITERFSVIDLKRDNGDDYSYSFTLKLKGNFSIRDTRSVQNSMRKAIVDDYLESYPSARRGTVIVDFDKFELEDEHIQGSAVILPLNILSLNYDPYTRKGLMRIRCEPKLLANARKCIKRNIEVVARDKNIALVSGKLPTKARFYLLGETMEDGILSIEFKTE